MTVAEDVAVENSERINPDTKFLKDVLQLGGESAKKCFQCGTCTATCNVSFARDFGESFPRKEMLWTQWGLKERALSDPAIWACHECHDCSASCPRGAKPGDVLAALRTLAIEEYSVPSSMARAYRDPSFLPVAFGIPAVALLFVRFLFGRLRRSPRSTGREVVFNDFIPDRLIEALAAPVFGFAILVSGIGVVRFWRGLRSIDSRRPSPNADPDLHRKAKEPDPPAREETIEASFVATLTDAAKHTDLRACQADSTKAFGHMGVLYGAPFLLFATAMAAIYDFAGLEPQQALSDPVKLVGNLGGLLVLAGASALTFNRIKAKSVKWGKATYFDWLFLGIIVLNVLTGLLVEMARVVKARSVAYPLYMIHLVVVFATFIYAPYGKFAHSFYRLTALTFLRHGNKTGLNKLFIYMPGALAAAVGAIGAVVGLWTSASCVLHGRTPRL